MPRKSLMLIGTLLIAWGVISLLGQIFQVDVSLFCWPLLLIAAGLYLIFRPRLHHDRPQLKIIPFPNIRRGAEWVAAQEELAVFAGDIRLDLTQAQLPPGETTLRVYGLVADIDVTAAPEVGILVVSTAFLTTGKMWGEKEDVFVSVHEKSSPNYAAAERKLRLELFLFVADLKIEQASVSID